MGELWRRIWFLLNRRRFERELQDEMDAHRAMKGHAEAPFGNSLRLRDEAVDAWGWRPLERLVQDVRFGARLLWRSPSFTVTAVAVLALGVGVNVAAFQLFDQLALSPRPVRDPETLVNLHRRSPRSNSTTFSYPAFAFYRQHARLLTGSMAVVSAGVTIGEGPERHVPASFVTADYFAELGGTPLLGRVLGPADDTIAAPPVVVLGETLWRSAFGADTGLVGRDIRINGRPFEVVGIVSGAFVGLEERAGLWIPIAGHAAAFPGSSLLQDWNGASVDFYARAPRDQWPAVEAELRSIADALRQQQPGHVWTNEWLELRDASRLVALEEAAPAFAMIGALVGLVLLAACMNLGLLVLARTVVRDREFSIRLSVGATRGRLVRQLLTEHLLLGLIGAAAGCVVAFQASTILRLATGAPSGIDSPFNSKTVLIAAMLAILAAVVFGFAPVWQTIRPAVVRRSRVRNVLLALQVTAASALLIVSGLLVRGVTRITQVSPGFDYHRTLVADPDLMSHGMAPEAAADYLRRVETRLVQTSAVHGVAISSLPPLGNRMTINNERTVFYGVTPAYFEVLQIPLLRGRIFAADEPGVVVISDSLAARRFPGEDPLGKRYDGDTIIGVVGAARTVRLNESAATECYRPIGLADMPMAVLVARVEGSPGAAVPTVRSVLQAEDVRLVPQVVTLEAALAAKLSGARQAAQLVSALGGCALLLAVIGVGGIVAFTVSQRLKEIGVRLALGARPAHVVQAVVQQFSVPLLAGAVSGSLLAAVAGFVLAGELYGISSFDPLAHLGALALFASIAAVATLPSLRRAVRVDPLHVLRHD